LNNKNAVNITQPLQKPIKHRKKLLSVMLFIILLTIIGTTIGILYVLNKNQLKSNGTSQNSSDVASKTQATIDKANALYQQGKKDEAIKLYQQAASLAGTKEQQNLASLSMATSYFNSGDYKDALTAAIAAENSQKDSNTEQFIASIYEKMGDNQNAIKYYQSAISLVDKTQPQASDDIEYYQSRIKALSN
jgi:tetratricopeptide (TPR) repeat protein